MNEKFQQALRAEDLDAIRLCPKSDLHNHGWAGADPVSVAAILGTTCAQLDHKLTWMDEMHAWVGENFGNPDPKLRPQLFEAAFVRAAKDGLVRFEIGDDVWATTLDGSANNVTSIQRADGTTETKMYDQMNRVLTDTVPQTTTVNVPRHSHTIRGTCSTAVCHSRLSTRTGISQHFPYTTRRD